MRLYVARVDDAAPTSLSNPRSCRYWNALVFESAEVFLLNVASTPDKQWRISVGSAESFWTKGNVGGIVTRVAQRTRAVLLERVNWFSRFLLYSSTAVSLAALMGVAFLLRLTHWQRKGCAAENVD